MAGMGEASRSDGHDFGAAFLLLSTAFDGDDAAPPGRLADFLSQGVPYPAPRLDSDSRVNEMPWRLVHAALWQMYANLFLLWGSGEPEIVHQARIGWRRLRSTCRLLRSVRHLPAPPLVAPLRPLMDHLRQMRDNDVARYQVLPRVAGLIPDRVAPGSRQWRQLHAAIEADTEAHRKVLRTLLEDPAIGQALWDHVMWLLLLREYAHQVPDRARDKKLLQHWARHRIAKMHHKFERARSKCRDEATRHRARIWAKRLRYATEDFCALLPAAAKKWRKQATRMQAWLGDERDLLATAALAEAHGATQIASEIRRLAALKLVHS